MSRFAERTPAPAKGSFVVTAYGRVGLVMDEKQTKNLQWWLGVQFVNSGPIGWFKAQNLTVATARQVADAGLAGVGGTTTMERT